MAHEKVMEKSYSIKEESLFEFLQNSNATFLLYIIIIAGIISAIYAIFTLNSNIAYIAYCFFGFCLFLCIGLLIGERQHIDTKDNIIENSSNKSYMLNMGYEVKKFYGNAVKSGFTKNKIRPLLLDAEKIKRHGLILATIGAGKSVLMKGLIEQHALLGGGALVIDGKGTAEFAKDIYGLMVSIGREDDFVHINFLDMDNTHTINPLLSGSHLAIHEILISLLEGEENEWKAKQKEFMKSILKLLVWKRDHENLKLDFSVLAEYLTLSRLVDEALNYRIHAYKSTEIQDFVQFVSGSLNINYNEFLEEESKEFIQEVKKQASNTDLQGVYDASMSAQAWRGIITNLKSDYGRVFNTQTPDISMWEAVQRNKILFVTLPTMASDTTPKELGRLILGLVKNVADEKARKAKEPEIPFLVLADEIGSYIVEGFGRLMSKSRALGISVWPIFQSYAQIDVIGKMLSGESSERKELIDVIGTHILMKNMNPEVSKFYSEFVPKIKFLEKSYSQRRDYVKGQMSVEQQYNLKEEEALLHSEVVGMNNGEMMMFIDGKMQRAIAQAETSLLTKGRKTTYEGNDMSKPLPLTQYMPKKEFFAIMEEYKDLLESKVA